jgi:SAM-dependent methyltransferase
MEDAVSTLAQPQHRCPLCGCGGRFRIAQPDKYLGLRPDISHPYYCCDACQHLFQPIIDTNLLLSFYPASYYQESGSSGLRSVYGRLRQANRARAVEWRARKGRALDVGCGRGLVLEELRRRGWQVCGMDWNPDNARAVSARLNIDVAAGPAGLALLDAESFDAISMFHVLEHEQQPLDLLRQVHRLLKPGGRLLIGVPRADSAARRLFGRHWSGYDFARHRQVFSARSLEAALRTTGFEAERLSGRFSDEMIDVYSSTALLLRSRSLAHPLLVAAVALSAAALIGVPRMLGRNSVMYAYARKC